jgi:hypothetical protein
MIIATTPLLLLLSPLILIAATAPIGVTICGVVAISQIRHSGGRLCGLGLALFDALLFPLLVLDGLIFWATYAVMDEIAQASLPPPVITDHGTLTPATSVIGLALLVTIIVCWILDSIIIRRAWRAAKRPVGPIPAPPGDAPADAPGVRANLTWNDRKRTLFLPLVGIRGGRRVIYWPGVFLASTIAAAVIAADAFLGDLVLYRITGVSLMGWRFAAIAVGGAIIVIGTGIRKAYKLPIERLYSLDTRPGRIESTPQLEQARQAVNVPAMGLLVIGAVYLGILAVAGIMWVTSGPSGPTTQPTFPLMAPIMGLAFMTATVFMILAASNMRQLRHRGSARAAGILACFSGPIGLIFGVWSLVILSRPDVVAAFAAGVAQTKSPSSTMEQSRQSLNTPRLSKLALASALGLPAALVIGGVVDWLYWSISGEMRRAAIHLSWHGVLSGIAVLISGIVCGIAALGSIANSNKRLTGRGLAIFGIVAPPIIIITLALLSFIRSSAPLPLYSSRGEGLQSVLSVAPATQPAVTTARDRLVGDALPQMEKLVQLQEEHCKFAQEKYRLGLLGRQDVCEAEIELLDAKIQLADAQGEKAVSRDEILGMFEKVVQLREEQYRIAKAKRDQGVGDGDAVLAAEKKLLEAKTRLAQRRGVADRAG